MILRRSERVPACAGFQRFLTSCWVIVEPPCASVPVQMLTTAARAMPTGSIAPCW